MLTNRLLALLRRNYNDHINHPFGNDIINNYSILSKISAPDYDNIIF